jgi:hypothetical protein
MAFNDIFGEADAVAQNLYDHATESAPGSVDSKIAKALGIGRASVYRVLEAGH